jgi:hypothetical protein
MSATLSALTTSWLRYQRSWGLWVLLILTAIGARFMVARDDGSAIVISVNNHLPVATSGMVGVSLGIVVSTLLLPAGFIYLRANTTRRQPWQIEEVTAASRVAIGLGRFAADCAVFGIVLAALTLAGWFLAWIVVAPGRLDLWQVTYPLWLIAAPAVATLAALRLLGDALPWTRGALGETVFLILWLASITASGALADRTTGLGANLRDFAGFARPLIFAAPPGNPDIAIGGVPVVPGRLDLDVLAGVFSPGYIPSRLLWLAIAACIAAAAGLLYRPHRPRRTRRPSRLAAWLEPGPPPAANLSAAAARPVVAPWIGLVWSHARLIFPGRVFFGLAMLAALAGAAGNFRHIGSPACLLLLIFGLSAQAGRVEARGLQNLLRTMPVSLWASRAGLVAAGVSWSAVLAVPAMPAQGPVTPLVLALGTGAVVSLVAVALAGIGGSAFAPRLVLLIVWYGYLSG